jgi:hypothetical protein
MVLYSSEDSYIKSSTPLKAFRENLLLRICNILVHYPVHEYDVLCIKREECRVL